MSSHETTMQPAIKCPHCGHAATDSWEWSLTADFGESDCDKCGGKFSWERERVAYYSTRAVELSEVEIKLKNAIEKGEHDADLERENGR